MENLTHSLLGAAIAELALPRTATQSQRRLFFTVGVIASNLPDADLVYTSVTPPPLGYLLHHRGHTHTLVGLVAQGLLVAAICLAPSFRRQIRPLQRRLWMLITVSLLSHLVLDSWNSYGVHPFYPFDMRWYYGDAIFIVEPWLWLFLGVAAMANTRSRRTRFGLGALIALLAVAFTTVGMLDAGALVALAFVAVAAWWLTSTWSSHTRSGAALAATALFVAMMFGLSAIAEARVLASLRPSIRGEIVDVVLNPSAAKPLCWSALVIEKDERGGAYTMKRGALSLVPRWMPVSGCGVRPGVEIAWTDAQQQSLAKLRERARADCRVRAWLQFGRAPVLTAGEIADLRFGDKSRGNFTDMPLTPSDSGAACPAHLTHWAMPREDLLASP